MKYAVNVITFDGDGNTIEEHMKHFCSEDCTNDFLFETFEVEGLTLPTFDFPDCEIGAYQSNCKVKIYPVKDEESDIKCEYGC